MTSSLAAIQDAFCFVMFVLIVAVIAAFFIRMRRHTPSVQQEGTENAEGEANMIEAMMVDQLRRILGKTLANNVQ